MHLISWKSSEDPAPGLFALELQPNTSSYIIQWKSYVSNENESYFTYSLYDPSIISRFVMDISGKIQQLSCWKVPSSGIFFGLNQGHNVRFMLFVGLLTTSSYSWNLSDSSASCARKTTLQCGNDSPANGKRDKFWEMPSVKLPDHSQTLAVGISPPSKKRMTLLLIIGITSVIVLCASISMCIWQRKMSKRKGYVCRANKQWSDIDIEKWWTLASGNIDIQPLFATILPSSITPSEALPHKAHIHQVAPTQTISEPFHLLPISFLST
ncbi:g-type lectin s-receptor-like serine/threonine-protein kinase [Quercus suber]|uniref:G-type lectin s-receptor-like serine/threonine-protein kinase n=1 Tax=Quercus suber TaxID=58331 RepID=A0AAW0M2Z4_QUESU